MYDAIFKYNELEKNMTSSNYLSIGDIAKAIGITRKIILNYEAKGLIVPDSKDGDKGNRYYTIDTFTKIRSIRLFQDLGLSLDEIKYYFDVNADLTPVIKRLETMRDELNICIEKLKERSLGQSDTISEITFDSQIVYYHTASSSDLKEKSLFLRSTALQAMKQYGTDVTKRMYFIEYLIDSPETITYCVAVPPKSIGDKIRKTPKLKGISYYHHGSYETLPAAREKLIAYAKQHNINLTGLFRHVYLEGAPQRKDPDHFITQVIAAIQE